MNRFVNSVLIGLVAFVGLLAVFAFAGLTGADGSGGAHATVTGVDAQWGASGPEGTEVRLDLKVQHPGTVPTEAVRIQYETLVDGIRFDEGTLEPGTSVAAGKETAITFLSRLGPDFPPQWWNAHTGAGEASNLLVRGTLTIAEGKAERVLPFEWNSSWHSDLPRLFSGLADCPRAGRDICLEDSQARWSGDRLEVTFTLVNAAPDGYRVRDGLMEISLAGITVATGRLQGGEADPSGRLSVTADLRFDGDALREWWPGHVARCESSQAQADLAVEVEDESGWNTGPWTWQTAPAPFQTAFLCNGGP